MNTVAEECIIEDLTSLVAQDVGADEPDMSDNNLSYVDIQDLFVTYQEPAEPRQEEATVTKSVAFVSPLDALKEVVLSLDWEMSSRNIERCQTEIELLLPRWQDDQHCTALLNILATIAKYLGTEKGNAHPDSIKVLTSVFVCLEKIVSSLAMDSDEKNALVAQEVVKFKTLRQKIAAVGRNAGKPASRELPKAQEVDALVALKAMVLSIDWGEISQERIDAFFAEIASLKQRWHADGTLVQGLEILRAYGQYIFVKKDSAHPDSFKQLFASYNSLERVLVSDHLAPVAKKDIIALELQKFLDLKKQIATKKEIPAESAASIPPAQVATPSSAAEFSPFAAEIAPPQQDEGGKAEMFLSAVDTRLDDFFAEKDASQAAELQVAELPRHETMPADDGGAPAAMFFEEDIAMAEGDEGPALFMEEATLPAVGHDVHPLQEEELFSSEVTTPILGVEESASAPSLPEVREEVDFMAEALPLAEQAEAPPSPGQTLSVAEEVSLAELSELISPHDYIPGDEAEETEAERSYQEAEELFAEGIVSRQEEPPAPASAHPYWSDDLALALAQLRKHCSDQAISALRQEAASLSAQQGLPPLVSIVLDLLDVVCDTLQTMAEGDRSSGAVLLTALCEPLRNEGSGITAAGAMMDLSVLQPLVHEYVAWRKTAAPPPAMVSAAVAPASVAAVPAPTEQPSAEATVTVEEAVMAPETKVESAPPQATAAPAGSFMDKIWRLFKK